LNGSFADLSLRLIPLFTTSSPRPRVLRVLRSAGIDIPIQPLPRTDRHTPLHNMVDSTPISTPAGSSQGTQGTLGHPPPPQWPPYDAQAAYWEAKNRRDEVEHTARLRREEEAHEALLTQTRAQTAPPAPAALQDAIPDDIPYKLAYSTPLCGPCGTNALSQGGYYSKGIYYVRWSVRHTNFASTLR
jgi:hypothetical protein